MSTSKRNLLEMVLAILTLMTILISVMSLAPGQGHVMPDSIRSLEDGWYRLEEGKKIPVDLSSTVHVDSEEDLVIYYDDLLPEDARKTISTRAAVYRIEMKLDDQQIYQYDDESFPRNRQMRAKLDCIALLSDAPENSVLSIRFQNVDKGSYQLTPVYVGKGADIFRWQCLMDVFTVLIVFTMWIIAGGCAGVQLYFRYIRLPECRLGNAGWLLFLCGCWCILDCSLVQQISGQSPIVCAISFYAFMTIVIPMLHFIRNTANMGRFRSLKICQALFYLNVIVQSMVHILFDVEYIDMLFFTHLLQAATCLIATYLMQKEYRATGNQELRALLQSVLILVAATLVELLLYWSMIMPCYGIIFELGILVFIIRLLCSITVSMAENLRFKAEAIMYKRLSSEDRLTGLDNRLSFEEKMLELERDAASFDNVALVFLDLNFLKKTNDSYGHEAGDALLIGAASCVRSAFASHGTCFRIGGDEFAVIIQNPQDDPMKWFRDLDQAIQTFNMSSRYRLSIARGISYLRSDDGQIKRFSDWKSEADHRMYRNKRLQKAKEAEESEGQS